MMRMKGADRVNNIRKTNCFFMVLMIVFIVTSIAWGIIPFGTIGNKMMIQKISILFPELLMFLMMIIYMGLNRYHGKELWRLHALSPLVIFLLIILGISLLPVVTFVNAISMMFTTNLVQGEMENLLSIGFPFSLFAMAVVPAFVEETVYRGVIGTTYMKYSFKKGIVLSAFLFGIMHMNFNQFSYAFILGIIFAIVVEATDSILSSMILHFIINGNSVVLAFLYTKIETVLKIEETSLETSQGMTWGMVASYSIPAFVCFCFACLLLYLIVKVNGRKQVILEKWNEKRSIYEERETLFSWHLAVAILLCLIVGILTEIGSRLAT